jgi:ABC-type microcin C transport system permease subunit YejE
MDLTLMFTRISNDGVNILVKTDKWSTPRKVPYIREDFDGSIDAQVAAAQRFVSSDYHDYLGWTILPVVGVWDIAHIFKRGVRK